LQTQKVLQVENDCRLAEERAARSAEVVESATAAEAARTVAGIEGERREAAEVDAKALMDQRVQCARIESRLAASEERETHHRDEVARLTAALREAEQQAATQAGLFARSEGVLQSEMRTVQSLEASQADLRNEEASVAGRLARVSQQAADSAQEVFELRTSLQTERAALLATRIGLSSEETELQQSPVERSPARGVKLRQGYQDVAKMWRLEHGHSVKAIVSGRSGGLSQELSEFSEG